LGPIFIPISNNDNALYAIFFFNSNLFTFGVALTLFFLGMRIPVILMEVVSFQSLTISGLQGVQ
jgi:hypothetical protein